MSTHRISVPAGHCRSVRRHRLGDRPGVPTDPRRSRRRRRHPRGRRRRTRRLIGHRRDRSAARVGRHQRHGHAETDLAPNRGDPSTRLHRLTRCAHRSGPSNSTAASRSATLNTSPHNEAGSSIGLTDPLDHLDDQSAEAMEALADRPGVADPLERCTGRSRDRGARAVQRPGVDHDVVEFERAQRMVDQHRWGSGRS